MSERLTQNFGYYYTEKQNIINVSDKLPIFENGVIMGKAIDKLAEFEDFMEEQGFESLEDLQHKINSWVNEEQVKQIAQKSIKDYLSSNGVQKQINELAIYKAMWQKLKEWLMYTLEEKQNSPKYYKFNNVLDKMQELEKQ